MQFAIYANSTLRSTLKWNPKRRKWGGSKRKRRPHSRPYDALCVRICLSACRIVSSLSDATCSEAATCCYTMLFEHRLQSWEPCRRRHSRHCEFEVEILHKKGWSQNVLPGCTASRAIISGGPYFWRFWSITLVSQRVNMGQLSTS